jgi:hypothetical protein
MTATAEVVHIPEPMLPMAAEQAAEAMAAYQALTANLLTEDDWQGIPGKDQSFVKRRGWAKLATFYGVSTELRTLQIDRDDQGDILRARCVARATHPNGRYAEGDGACAITERRFATPAGRQKIEHDLPATAATRAVNRAISNLIGFGEVSAEETDPPGPPPPRPAAPWGPLASDEQENAAAAAVRAIAPDVEAERFVLLLGQGFDGVPVAAVKALTGLAKYIAAAHATAEPADDDVYPPAEQGLRHQGD